MILLWLNFEEFWEFKSNDVWFNCYLSGSGCRRGWCIWRKRFRQPHFKAMRRYWVLGVKPPPAVLVHAEIMPVTDKRARGLEYSMLLLRNVFHVFYNQCHYSYIYSTWFSYICCFSLNHIEPSLIRLALVCQRRGSVKNWFVDLMVKLESYAFKGT